MTHLSHPALYFCLPALLSVVFHPALRKSACDATVCQQQQCLHITEIESSQNISTSLSLSPALSLAASILLRLVLCVSSMELAAF